MPLRLAALAHGGRLHCTPWRRPPCWEPPGSPWRRARLRRRCPARPRSASSSGARRSAANGSRWRARRQAGSSRRQERPVPRRLRHRPLRDEVHQRLAAAGDEARGAAEEPGGDRRDVVRDDDRHQRGDPGRPDRLERGSDQRQDRGHAEQRVRELRGAGRPPVDGRGRGRDPDLRRATGGSEVDRPSRERADALRAGRRGANAAIRAVAAESRRAARRDRRHRRQAAPGAIRDSVGWPSRRAR